jgi:hypothetical protein
VFLEILVDSELAVILLSIHPVCSFDIGLALEDDDERANTDLNKGEGSTINDVTPLFYILLLVVDIMATLFTLSLSYLVSNSLYIVLSDLRLKVFFFFSH